MNKAFLREPDVDAEYRPRCGTQGEPVGEATLREQLPARCAGRAK
jgi:hypothetical protein